MTSVINASTTTGISLSSDTTGNLAIQTSGTTVATAAGGALTVNSYSAGASLITSGTAQNTTSGTSIDFTGIPSWVKRVTVMFSGVSTNGTSSVLVRIGDSGGISATGYQSAVMGTVVTSSSIGASSTAYVLGGASASNTCIGNLTINLAGTNNWIASGVFYFSDTQINSCAGAKTLSGALTTVRITTVNGTDTFDAGSINILYE